MELKYHRYDVTEIYVFSLNMLELCMITAMPRIFVPENVFIYTFDRDCDKFRLNIQSRKCLQKSNLSEINTLACK